MKTTRCRFEPQCYNYSTFKVINPSSQLILDGSSYSSSTNIVSNQFYIYYTFDSTMTVWQQLINTNGLASGILALNKIFDQNK